MKNYYEENKAIFKLVEKRETLFRTMEEFEVQHGFIIKKNPKITIHLRRPWTSTFFKPASWTVGFSLRLKNSGHVITFLGLWGLQNTDHVMPFWFFPRTGYLMFLPSLSKSRGRKDVLCSTII